jgi:hypothetical protein
VASPEAAAEHVAVEVAEEEGPLEELQARGPDVKAPPRRGEQELADEGLLAEQEDGAQEDEELEAPSVQEAISRGEWSALILADSYQIRSRAERHCSSE